MSRATLTTSSTTAKWSIRSCGQPATDRIPKSPTASTPRSSLKTMSTGRRGTCRRNSLWGRKTARRRIPFREKRVSMTLSRISWRLMSKIIFRKRPRNLIKIRIRASLGCLCLLTQIWEGIKNKCRCKKLGKSNRVARIRRCLWWAPTLTNRSSVRVTTIWMIRWWTKRMWILAFSLLKKSRTIHSKFTTKSISTAWRPLRKKWRTSMKSIESVSFLLKIKLK